MSMQDTMTETQNGVSDTASNMSNVGKQLMEKASNFFKGLQGNDQVKKVSGWVKENPRAAAGIGVALGALLLNRLRR